MIDSTCTPAIGIPKRVFIVPYRNRVQHKFFFSKYMSFILEDCDDYEIYFSHQCDARTFNRGATRNIGFLAVKNKYPEHYKDITFIFNDVDTIPFNKIFDYQTYKGVVKHYYGYKYTLGGIVVMKGEDFEKINGYPCFWGWGMEDNCLQKRCEANNILIDRSNFYNIGSPQILQLFDGISRIISKKDPWRMEHDDGVDGLKTIHKLEYTIDDKSENLHDNLFSVHNSRIFFINIKTFLTKVRYENDQYYNYDLREPKRQIVNPNKLKETRKVVSTTDDWSNIPYYPTTKERREQLANDYIAKGQAVPETLLTQIKQDKMDDVKEDAFNKNIDIDNMNIHTQVDETKVNNTNHMSQNNSTISGIKYNYIYHNNHHHHHNNHNNHNNHHNDNHNNHNHNHTQKMQINKYSPEYANYIGAKPKATASAKMRLGGIY